MTKLAGGKVNNSSKEDRSESDFYPTPKCATISLLEKEKFEGNIYEPACGDGRLSIVLKEFGYDVYSSDLRDSDDIFGEKGIDFLNQTQKFDNIITNPPFSLAGDFIEHGLNLSNNTSLLLLRLSYLEGQSRYGMFKKNPPSRIYVFSKRLPFFKDGIWSKSGGQFCHSWFVWDKQCENKNTIIDWLMPNTNLI
jgi:hypothetical protein